ncbi:MAG: UvrD-helicase domain-containing protein, partial [Desulfobacterales bacterium]|nr:UvrD-helicase domain-containing protein [Desulfobacterales bacterium]
YADYLKTELARRKQAANVQSFDDLLTAVQKALASDPASPLARAIREKFDAALIDEFQDTDPIQYDIFKTAFNRPGRRLFLIGDPKQAIYGFRGADVFAYLRAAAEIPDGRKYTLTENWRSATDLVAATNHFFDTAANPFVLEKTIAFHSVQAAEKSGGNRAPLRIEGDSPENLILWFINRDTADSGDKSPTKDQAREAAAGATVYEIARLLNLAAHGQARLGDRPVRPSDIAILVTRNVDAQLFKDQLGQLQIPAVITRSENIFATNEAREVEHILAAAASPGSPINLNTALATDLLGCPADTLRAYTEDEAALPDYEQHMDRFAKYHDMWQAQGFIRMFRSLLADYDVPGNLLAQPHGERQLTNVLHLSELIHAAAFENDLGLNGVLSWISEQKLSEEESEAQELRLERDDEAVQILTVFRSKGLQYPIVFCPFMWQQNAAVSRGNDLVYHAADQLCLDIGAVASGSSHWNRAAMENLSELVRLLYVAVTRAANRCYLSCGKF